MIFSRSCERYNIVVKELEEYYLSYGYCAIGMEFTNPRIIYKLADIVRQGRADNIKEAINILFTDAHRDRMEMLAEEMAANTAVTPANTATIASDMNTAAVFCMARFFLK